MKQPQTGPRSTATTLHRIVTAEYKPRLPSTRTAPAPLSPSASHAILLLLLLDFNFFFSCTGNRSRAGLGRKSRSGAVSNAALTSEMRRSSRYASHSSGASSHETPSQRAANRCIGRTQWKKNSVISLGVGIARRDLDGSGCWGVLAAGSIFGAASHRSDLLESGSFDLFSLYGISLTLE